MNSLSVPYDLLTVRVTQTFTGKEGLASIGIDRNITTLPLFPLRDLIEHPAPYYNIVR
jgi:hypothetical protein